MARRFLPSSEAMGEIRGLFTAMVTPFRADGDLHIPALKSNIARLLPSGIRGIEGAGGYGRAVAIHLVQAGLVPMNLPVYPRATAPPNWSTITIGCSDGALAMKATSVPALASAAMSASGNSPAMIATKSISELC